MHLGNQTARSPHTENSFHDVLSQEDKRLSVVIRKSDLPSTTRACSTAMENPKGIKYIILKASKE